MKIKKYIIAFLFLLTLIGLSRYKDLNLIPSESTLVDEMVWDYNYLDTIIAQPQIFMDDLVVQTETSVFAQNIHTGKLRWKSSLPIVNSMEVPSNPVPISINQGRIAFQTQSDVVAVFDLGTGKFLWNSVSIPVLPDSLSETSDFVRDMEIYDDLVLVTTHNSRITAYEITTGKVVWSNLVPDRTNLVLMPENDKVYLGTIDSIITYSLVDGKIISEKPLSGSVWDYFHEDGFVYIAFMNGDCSFGVIRLETMEYEWCVNNSTIQHLNGNIDIVADDDHVYFAGDKLVSLSKRTGRIEWSTDGQYSFGNSINQNNFLYVVDSVYISKISKLDGKEIAKIRISEDSLLFYSLIELSHEPLIHDNLIFFFKNKSVIVYVNPVE